MFISNEPVINPNSRFKGWICRKYIILGLVLLLLGVTIPGLYLYSRKGLLRTLGAHNVGIVYITFSPNGTIASSDMDGIVHICDVMSGERIQTFRARRFAFECLVYSPDGSMLACAGQDGTVIVWDVNGGLIKTILEKGEKKHSMHAVAFSSDGLLLASGGNDMMVTIWDIATGKVIASNTHHDIVRSVAFSPREHVVASRTEDGIIHLWDLRDQKTTEFPGEDTRLTLYAGVQYSPDGKMIAANGHKNGVCYIRMWNVDTGEVDLVVRANQGKAMLCEALSPDGLMVAGATADGMLWVWNAIDGNALWTRRIGLSTSICFSPSGNALAVGHVDGTVQIWSVPKES